MNKLRNRFGRILKNPGDVILTEDYVELNQEARKKHAPRILVRTFRLHDFESVKEILDSIREGYTIGLINMLPLKDKDSIGLKRAIDKLKKTIEANSQTNCPRTGIMLIKNSTTSAMNRTNPCLP